MNRTGWDSCIVPLIQSRMRIFSKWHGAIHSILVRRTALSYLWCPFQSNTIELGRKAVKTTALAGFISPSHLFLHSVSDNIAWFNFSILFNLLSHSEKNTHKTALDFISIIKTNSADINKYFIFNLCCVIDWKILLSKKIPFGILFVLF